MTKRVMDAEKIAQAVESTAAALAQREQDFPLAIVGIHRGGEPLARRLATRIEEVTGTRPPVGSVDITLYRDDGFGPHDWPTVGKTELPFAVKEHTVVLVDDVLYTGRTVRAAIDAILDYGRPKAVRLVVLVDRGQRELPIAADIVGERLDTRPGEHVTVHLVEAGAESDHVTVEAAGAAGEES